MTTLRVGGLRVAQQGSGALGDAADTGEESVRFFDAMRPRHIAVKGHCIISPPPSNKPHVVYKIEVVTRSGQWVVFRRYSEFVELQKQLMRLFRLTRDLLPAKKITGNLKSSVIHEREHSLQLYLQRLINSDEAVVFSAALVQFLDILKHDVVAVAGKMARYIRLHQGALSGDDPFQLTPNQCRCVAKRRLLPLQEKVPRRFNPRYQQGGQNATAIDAASLQGSQDDRRGGHRSPSKAAPVPSARLASASSFRSEDGSFPHAAPPTLAPPEHASTALQERVEDSEEDIYGMTADLPLLYEFCLNLERLIVCPRVLPGSDPQAFYTDSAVIDLQLFPSLRSLQILHLAASQIQNFSSVHECLTTLKVSHCSVHQLKYVLVDNVTEKKRPIAPTASGIDAWRVKSVSKLSRDAVVLRPWKSLTSLDLSYNHIPAIDPQCIELLPVLQVLNLAYNDLDSINPWLFRGYTLTSLTVLDLSHNDITTLVAPTLEEMSLYPSSRGSLRSRAESTVSSLSTLSRKSKMRISPGWGKRVRKRKSSGSLTVSLNGQCMSPTRDSRPEGEARLSAAPLSEDARESRDHISARRHASPIHEAAEDQDRQQGGPQNDEAQATVDDADGAKESDATTTPSLSVPVTVTARRLSATSTGRSRSSSATVVGDDLDNNHGEGGDGDADDADVDVDDNVDDDADNAADDNDGRSRFSSSRGSQIRGDRQRFPFSNDENPIDVSHFLPSCIKAQQQEQERSLLEHTQSNSEELGIHAPPNGTSMGLPGEQMGALEAQRDVVGDPARSPPNSVDPTQTLLPPAYSHAHLINTDNRDATLAELQALRSERQRTAQQPLIFQTIEERRVLQASDPSHSKDILQPPASDATDPDRPSSQGSTSEQATGSLPAFSLEALMLTHEQEKSTCDSSERENVAANSSEISDAAKPSHPPEQSPSVNGESTKQSHARTASMSSTTSSSSSSSRSSRSNPQLLRSAGRQPSLSTEYGRYAPSHNPSLLCEVCPNLRKLYLSANMLTTTCGLEGLKDLTVLDISDNRIDSIQGLASLSQLQSLVILKMKGNPVAATRKYRKIIWQEIPGLRCKIDDREKPSRK